MTPRRTPGDAQALNARRAALRVLLSTDSIPFDIGFDREMERRPLAPRDRALARSLAMGSLKLRRRLDFMLDTFLEGKHKPLPQAIREILRLGAYQLSELSRVPAFAAVSTSVELAKQFGHPGTSRLVNAVLRRFAAFEGEWKWPDVTLDSVSHLATRYSYPNWIVRRWLDHLSVEETTSRCKAGNRKPGSTIRLVREAVWQPAQLEWLALLDAESRASRWFPEYRYLPDAPDVAPVMEHHGADCVVQNESAAASVYLLDLKPGETVLDMCAAPGGKLSHAFRFVGEQGRLLAFDVQPRRLRRLNENLSRLAIRNAVVARADARQLPVAPVHKILLDAPCTGLGLLHRHPELRWQKRPEDLKRLCELQRELLDAAVAVLAPGGRLVYSTCSTCEEENEDQIVDVLKRHPNLSVVDPRPLLPEGVPATNRWMSLQPDPPRLDGAFACALNKA